MQATRFNNLDKKIISVDTSGDSVEISSIRIDTLLMLLAATTADDRDRMREMIDGNETAMCRRIAVCGPLGSSSSFGYFIRECMFDSKCKLFQQLG
jgi:hypothetical protein